MQNNVSFILNNDIYEENCGAIMSYYDLNGDFPLYRSWYIKALNKGNWTCSTYNDVSAHATMLPFTGAAFFLRQINFPFT